jgi:hypothetical protein
MLNILGSIQVETNTNGGLEESSGLYSKIEIK